MGKLLLPIASLARTDNGLEAAGIDPAGEEADQVAALLSADHERWNELAKRAGIESPN